ncbi:flagellar biosynthesis protein FlhB [Marinicrinis lubricantis]|uniref:Flagellar biosynthetic protein FlhB n=1 Tax=Marinicrinis lubricantis TaxID=2086470 RepID=A0ABW1IMD7_9BACL
MRVTTFEPRMRMNLQFFSQEKTEKATPKKRSDSRKKGQVAKTAELPSALILLFSFLTLFFLGGYFKERIHHLFLLTFNKYMVMDVSIHTVLAMASEVIWQILLLLMPIMLVAVLFGFIGNYVQFGLLFTGEPLKMKLNKLNPIEGFKRIFGLRSLVELLKSIIKLLVIGLVVFYTIWKEKDNILALATVPLDHIYSYIAGLTLNLGLQIGVLLIVLAVLDYFYQKYEYEKGLKMSKQDIKDEYKKAEGDPKIKGKIRERQRRMAMQRMMQEIPNADVVITNPTHFAVAIKYDNQQMDAPTVIAKGQDFLALKIREKAKEHGIMTMENKPLARALYHQVEIGEAIPAELFQAVAEVLAYVYKLQGKTSSNS